MGEIADDMISGVCCSGCGQYFTREHGYPVVCQACRDDGWTIQELAHYPINQGEENIMDREQLQKEHGEVWNTEEATKKFEFQSFLAPFAIVIRKSDRVKGTIMFQDMPRFYFNFQEKA